MDLGDHIVSDGEMALMDTIMRCYSYLSRFQPETFRKMTFQHDLNHSKRSMEEEKWCSPSILRQMALCLESDSDSLFQSVCNLLFSVTASFADSNHFDRDQTTFKSSYFKRNKSKGTAAA